MATLQAKRSTGLGTVSFTTLQQLFERGIVDNKTRRFAWIKTEARADNYVRDACATAPALRAELAATNTFSFPLKTRIDRSNSISKILPAVQERAKLRS
jgi:hypothetical protein